MTHLDIFTGRGGIAASDSIKAILDGVENHLTRSTSSSLQKITVVVFEQNVLDAYCRYFKKRNDKVNAYMDLQSSLWF